MLNKLDKQELKKRLTSLQFKVTQQNDTEDPFKNAYFDCEKQGTYKCIVCSKPLFSSNTKYNSGCGWPAFYGELQNANIIKKVQDYGDLVGTQIRCGDCDSHLGHLFEDGPQEKGGIRYCVNSASLNLHQKK